MGLDATAILAIRVINALLWTFVLAKIIRNGPVTGLTRLLVCLMLGGSFWLFVLGGFVPYGVSMTLARLVTTAFAAITAITGFVLLMRGKV